MDELSLGVIATSRKEHELRLPIHPRHLARIDVDLRRRMFLERATGDGTGSAATRSRRSWAVCGHASS